MEAHHAIRVRRSETEIDSRSPLVNVRARCRSLSRTTKDTKKNVSRGFNTSFSNQIDCMSFPTNGDVACTRRENRRRSLSREVVSHRIESPETRTKEIQKHRSYHEVATDIAFAKSPRSEHGPHLRSSTTVNDRARAHARSATIHTPHNVPPHATFTSIDKKR